MTDARRPWLVAASAVGVAAVALGRVGWRGEGLTGHLADDFFYYAVLADHLARDGAATFDGHTPTDGFHPGWMAVIVALRAVFGRGDAFLLSIVVVSGAAVVAFVDRLARAGDRLGTPWAAPIAALFGFQAALVGLTGMEVAAWVASWAALLARDAAGPPSDAAEGARRGLLAAALALLRLDGGLFSAIWAVATWRTAPRRAWAGLAAGLAPWPLWLFAHAWRFGAWVPVSGQAKGLGGPGWPSPSTWASFVDFDGVGTVIVHPGLALGLAGAIALAVRGPRPPALVATLLFAPGFYAAHLLRSDWPFWNWYAFPALVGGAAGAMVLSRGAPGPALRVPAAAGAVLFGLWGLGYVLVQLAGPHPSFGLAVADGLRPLVAGRPGPIGMGDYAGSPAWVLDRPFVQLEGLVAGRDVVGALARQDPLPALLEAQGVAIYVGEPETVEGACATFGEPRRGGPRVPRSRWRTCAAPIGTFAVGDRTWWVIARPDGGW